MLNLYVYCIYILICSGVWVEGQVSVSSSAAASVKYPPPGAGGSPQAYISSLSSAKADPKIPVTVNDGAAEERPKSTWAYVGSDDAYGPENWHKIAPQCAGLNQSPINIVADQAVPKPLESPLALQMADGGPGMVQGKLLNNGKTIGFNLQGGGVNLVGGILGGDTYILKQFHFHFGCKGQKGSEHTMNGEGYDGELHLLFKNTKYPNPKVAMQQRDGLAILAFFLKANPDADPNPAFGKIANNLANVQMPHQQVVLPGGVAIKNLIPALKEGINNLRRFVYKGSLPTPPCYESVTWVVFRRVINLVPERFTQFRSLYRGGGQPLCGNTRPIQKRNNRELFYFEPPPPTTAPPTTVARSTTGAPKSTTGAPRSSTKGASTTAGATTGAGGPTPTESPI